MLVCRETHKEAGKWLSCCAPAAASAPVALWGPVESLLLPRAGIMRVSHQRGGSCSFVWVGGMGAWVSTELPAGIGAPKMGKKPSKIRVLCLPFFCLRG